MLTCNILLYRTDYSFYDGKSYVTVILCRISKLALRSPIVPKWLKRDRVCKLSILIVILADMINSFILVFCVDQLS